MTPQSYDAFDIALQEATREAAEDRAKLKARIEIEDLKRVMGNKPGRRFVYGLLERAGVWRLSFHTNALQMAFNEGNRNEGLALLAKMMAHCPDLHAQMLKEHTEDE
jgi:hypothetical protein